MSIQLWNKQNGDELVASTTALVLTHCWCGIPVGVPQNLYRYAKRHSEQSIYCPLGHTFIFTDAMDVENARLKDEKARLAAELAQTEARLLGQTKAKTRFKNQRDKLRTRVAAGVCPCCGRSFKQLAAHMQNKHPDYPPVE